MALLVTWVGPGIMVVLARWDGLGIMVGLVRGGSGPFTEKEQSVHLLSASASFSMDPRDRELCNQPKPDEKVFSIGLELAAKVLTSNLLQRSLDAIQNLNNDLTKKNIRDSSLSYSLVYKAYDDDQNKWEIIAFGCENGGVLSSSVSSETLEQNPHEFNFLQSKNHPFSVNEEALKLFRSLHHQDPDLFQRLKNPSKPLIVTGHSVGGSIASLFCLWLLENIHQSNRNIPICITFGSPLLGDDVLRQAILNRSGWNPRFLHVVSNDDVIPQTFLSSTTNSYMPFGTFLMCSLSGSACFDHPDSVLSLLEAMGGYQLPNLMDYVKLLKNLTYCKMVLSNGASQLHELRDDPLRAGIILQLDAIGDNRMQEDKKEDTLITAIMEREKWSYTDHKDRITGAERKLNARKIDMANLEWYKKISSTVGAVGYYDCYKSNINLERRNSDAVTFKRRLNKYWEKLVEEAERKPRKEGVVPLAGIRQLYGGTNYRRMVEPLDIADYYKGGTKRNYCTQGRPKHYQLLQKWQEEHERATNKPEKKSNSRDRLTEDSCFWADVEEAMILTKSLKNGEESSIENLKNFEDKVKSMIDNLAVSPDIFLEGSTFMQWWNEYKNIPECTHRSSLADFMEKKLDKKYI
ncbi:hypothetical protein NE237_006162 [Protea cynaroides]|uniref:Senescence-associated carboxylesterase 101 n=1 Tax=Protea cynaroides TaxID=273540 RepID=A0A9Q0QV17_9MAGN|nr:hypothetical protein NE237_006162 [Protea cynaroides]